MTSWATKLAQKLLNDACHRNASDIHFYPFLEEDKIEIYYRILGERRLIRTMKKRTYESLLTYLKFASGMDIGEIRKPQNGTLPFMNDKNESFSLRLSTLPLSNTESMSIRILPQEKIPLLEQLFLFPTQLKKMKSWLNHRAGIILFTGPTGSGKSTTMYALLEAILKEKPFQVITLEEPIEIKIPNVLQVEINEKAGITYQPGLKAALRHDPDILLIGEIRDEETAQFAFRAALTGHLVLSTLHAKDAIGTIERLIDLGINRTELSQSLIAIAALQLLPIISRGKIHRRAAIVELLDEHHLQHAIEGAKHVKMNKYHTFQYLKEKAFTYGFITKETFQETYERTSK